MKTAGPTIAAIWLLAVDVAAQVRTPQFMGVPTEMMKEFKEKNLLRDDFDAPGQLVLEEEFSIGNEVLSFADNDLIPFEGVFTDTAEYFLDGVKQAALPPVTVFRSSSDRNVLVSKSEGALKRAAKTDPVTGETMTLIPMEEESQFFVEVMPDDTDSEKLSEFSFGESEVVGVQDRFLRSLDNSVRERVRKTKRSLAVTCESFDLIELAVAYEHLFCDAFGGPVQANAVVQAIVADISLKYQQEGLCTKVSLSHLDGNCDANDDPYAVVFETNGNENAICGNPISQLRIFQDYWRNNKSNVRRDAAHLFHGYPHSTRTIGCAYIGVLCNTFSGYAVNEVTYGGNRNQVLWNVLVAHELGHNAGTRHDGPNSGFIMNPGVCDCQTFSQESIAQMRDYMDDQTCLEDIPIEPRTPPPVPPTSVPTARPTARPTASPTLAPTKVPTARPSASPTKAPTPPPTDAPTLAPTPSPSKSPVTASPTKAPTPPPTDAPTPSPTKYPTTQSPSSSPTMEPTSSPTTPSPTTEAPTVLSGNPSVSPTTASPTIATDSPTLRPNAQPSITPTTSEPSVQPSATTTSIKPPPTQVDKTVAPTPSDDDKCISLGEPVTSPAEARECFNKFPAARCNYLPSKFATCQDGEPACLRSTELSFSVSTYTCGDEACFTGSPEGSCSEQFASCSRTPCCDGLRCLYGIVCF